MTRPAALLSFPPPPPRYPRAAFWVFLFLLLMTGGLPPLLRADVDRSQPPPAGPAPAVAFPDYREETLANGLKIFFVESRRQPTVTFRLVVKSGEAFDGGKPGLAQMTASLLNKGTATRSAAEFANAADFLGASVEAGAGPDATYVTASGLTKFLPQILDLFADAVLRPAFPEAELAKERRTTLSRLIQQRQQPAVLAGKLRGKLLYGGHHPYGEYPTEQSVGAMRRGDLVAFHRTHFQPNNATLAVVGDIRAAELLPLLEKAFGGWQSAGRAPTLEMPPVPEPQKLTIHLVDRPGSVQSDIAVAAPGIARDNPDLAEVLVVNSVLGGGFSGRLFANLRERHGYTYAAGSNFLTNRAAGLFFAGAEVRNAVTLPAIREILAEIERLRQDPVPVPELTMQRDYLAGNYLLSLESPSRTAERVQEIDLYGLPADFYKHYAQRLSSVSVEDAQRLARKYLPSSEQLTIIVVGEAKEVKKSLEELGPVIVYDTDLRAKGE